MKNLVKLSILTMALGLVKPIIAAPVGEFAIANRGGSLSFLNQDSSGELSVAGDLSSTKVDEPMYVTPLGNSKGQRMIAFADRTRNLLSVVNANSKEVLSQIEISKGAFHQFSHPLVGLKVALATDIEKGMDLIEVSDSGKKLTLRHFSLPSSLDSGKPHDVVMDRKFAYLTVKGVQDTSGKKDVLLQISLKDLKLVSSKTFTEDIHLFNPVKASFFTVVEQATGNLNLIEKGTMNTLQTLKVAKGVHGITGAESGRFLFITDIDEQAGSPSVYALSVGTQGAKVMDSVALNVPTAHNIAVDDRGRTFKIVVTHSGGTATQNSVLNFSTTKGKLSLEKDIRSGTNPFGLTFF